MADVAHRRPRELDGGNHAGEAALHQGDVAGFHGDVGSGAHGETDVGLGERRGVVDPVTDHGHDFAFALQQLDLVGLVVGQDLGEDSIDADAVCNGGGGAEIVTGEHHDLESEIVHACNGRLRVVLHRVGDSDHADDVSVDTDDHCGLALVGEPLGHLLGRFGPDALVPHELQVAEDHPASPDRGGDAEAGRGLEVCSVSQRHAATAGAVDDGFTEGMFGTAFCRGRQCEDLVFAEGTEGYHVGQGRFATSDGARLVEHDRGEPLRRLEGVAGLDEDARFGPLPDTDHQRCGCGETEGAGAGDDEHGHGGDHCVGQHRSRSHCVPGHEGENGNDHDRGHEVACDLVDGALNRCLGTLGVTHHLDDLGQHRVLPDPGGAEAECAGLVDRGSDHRVALHLLDRNRLTGHH